MAESTVVASVVAALIVAVLAAYSLRVASAGRLMHPRLARVQGTALFPRWAVEALYWFVQAPGRACVALHVRADWLSWGSLVLGLATLPLAATGRLATAGAMFVLAAMLDALDGLVARQTGTASDAGEVLDAIIDRYADAAPLLGLAIHYRESPLAMMIPLAALVGSFMVSYDRAKAEAMGLELRSGTMRRHERVAYVSGALILAPQLPLVTGVPGALDAGLLGTLAFVALLSNLEALRLAHAARVALRAAASAGTTPVSRASGPAALATGSTAPAAVPSAPSAAPATPLTGSSAAASDPAGRPPRVTPPLPGPRSRALREREEAHLAPGFQAIAAHAGIAIERGEGAELLDVDGNRFLDLAAGIGVAALGYSHPGYVAALAAQLARTHAGSFTTEARVRALEALAAVAPEGLTRAQLYSGGAEAVESAIRLARAHTGKFEVLSFWGGFHGKTTGVLAQMGSDFKHGLGPLPPGAYLTPYADCARCPFKVTHPGCGLLCVEFARDKLARETTGRLAAILVEPMQGTAGNVIPPPDFLPAVADLAREQGALLVADEMITGFGRTGRMFAVEATGVRPDVMTVGKALGGGFPVSAVLVGDDVARATPWSKPSFSSSSYGGNPLAGAAVAAALEIIRRDDLPGNAARVGAILKAGLEDIARRHPAVANVRGEGLLVGFDLLDSDGKPWPPTRCKELFGSLLRRGLLTMAYAPRVRVNPPLVFTAGQAAEALDLLEGALSDARA